ncbi:MAG: hypothetical protein HYX47_13775 [Burkholderiales bacterium]|nr:hypothetical protein [Burkholderiales bacterium]
MPIQVSGAQGDALQLYQAFYGSAPPKPAYQPYVDVTTTYGAQPVAQAIGAQFQPLSDSVLATRVLGNLGITTTSISASSYSSLQTALVQAFAAYPNERGTVILNLSHILTGLETDATYGTVATAYNQSITDSFAVVTATATNPTQWATVNSDFAAGTSAYTEPATGSPINAVLTAAGTATNDVMNLTAGTTISGGRTFGTVSSIGFETVNFTSNTAAGNANSFNFIAMSSTASTETLNISGNANTILLSATADVINASALTGALTLSASAPAGAAAVQITGGSGNDDLTGSAAVDTISGGSGNDRIYAGPTGAAGQADFLSGGSGSDQFRFAGTTNAELMKVSAGATAIVKITDFTPGVDKIALIGGGFFGGNFISATVAPTQTVIASNLADIYAGITAIAASTSLNVSAVIVNVIGAAAGTYLYVNDAAGAGVSSTNDMLINLTGMVGTFTAADFAFS